jgi:hypothetical protein
MSSTVIDVQYVVLTGRETEKGRRFAHVSFGAKSVPRVYVGVVMEATGV